MSGKNDPAAFSRYQLIIGCAAGAGPVYDHHRFFDHVGARRHHHAMRPDCSSTK